MTDDQRKLIEEFEPVGPRERAMVKRCHLRMRAGDFPPDTDQDSVRCPCERPEHCHILTEIFIRQSEDEE